MGQKVAKNAFFGLGYEFNDVCNLVKTGKVNGKIWNFFDHKMETTGNFRVQFLEIIGNFRAKKLEVNGKSLLKKYPRIGNYKSNN